MDAKWAITTIVAVVLSVGTSCYTLTRSLGTVEGKVDGIEKRFTDLGRQVDRIDDANVKLDDYVRRLEVSVGGLERDVKRFEAGVNAFGGFEGRLLNLQTEHKAIQGSVERLRSDAPAAFNEDVSTRLRRIEDRLNELMTKLLPGTKPSA